MDQCGSEQNGGVRSVLFMLMLKSQCVLFGVVSCAEFCSAVVTQHALPVMAPVLPVLLMVRVAGCVLLLVTQPGL